MASAATASPPAPPAASTPSAAPTNAASTFSRISSNAVSALFGGSTSSAGPKVSNETAATFPLASPASGSTEPALLTLAPRRVSTSARAAPAAVISSSGQGITTAAVPLAVSQELSRAGDPSSPLRNPGPSDWSTPTSNSKGSLATPQRGATRSPSSSSSSSWTAAARNASMAPYRVLAAALPGLLNVSSGAVARGPGAGDSGSQHGTEAWQSASGSGHGEAQSDDEEGGRDAPSAWQTPELGAATLGGSTTVHSPSAQSLHLPHANVGAGSAVDERSAAVALLQAIASSNAGPSAPAVSSVAAATAASPSASHAFGFNRRPSTGLASLVHVHETTSASDSDWDGDDADVSDEGERSIFGAGGHSEGGHHGTGALQRADDEEEDGDSDAGSMDMAYHHDTIRASMSPAIPTSATLGQAQTRRRRRRHRRQESTFFSISSVNGPSLADHGDELARHEERPSATAFRPTLPPRSSSHGYNLVEGGEAFAELNAGVGADSILPVPISPLSRLMPSPVIEGDATISLPDSMTGDNSNVSRTPSTSSTTASSELSAVMSIAPSASASISASASTGSSASRPEHPLSRVHDALGLGLNVDAGFNTPKSALASHQAEHPMAGPGPEVAAEDNFAYYHLHRAGTAVSLAPTTTSLQDQISTASVSDGMTAKGGASSLRGLETPHPSLLTLNTAKPASSSHEEAFAASSSTELGADGTGAVLASVSGQEQLPIVGGLVASPIEMEGNHDERFASLGVPPHAAHTPKRVDGGSRGASASQQSTPATVVPGNATIVPASPELDIKTSPPSLVPESKLDAESAAQTSVQRQQMAAKRAEHRRELQRLALLELVRTERSYADDLALLVMVFFENLVVLPSFASNAISASSSDLGRSDSRSGTESEDASGASGQAPAQANGAAAVASTPEERSRNGAHLQPSPLRIRTSNSPASAGGGSTSSPLNPSPRPESGHRFQSSTPSRISTDPALERLDLVTRNAEDLLSLHQSAAWRLEAIVAQHGLDHPYEADSSQNGSGVKVKVTQQALEEGTRKVADYLTNTLAPALRDLYAPFCSRHMEAFAIIKDAEQRSAPEWLAYERTCADILQVVAARISPSLASPSAAAPTGSETTMPAGSVAMEGSSSGNGPTSSGNHHHNGHPTTSPIAPLLKQGTRPHKLVFHDYFVKPIQRIALYPLLLQSLLKYCSDDIEEDSRADDGKDETGKVRKPRKDGEAVRAAVEALVGAVEHVNEAGRQRLEERLSQTIVERIETHFNVTPSFLSSMGHCLMAGTLDVLYHQRQQHPLSSPLRLKYLGCVLYQGFMLIVKVRKSATYEPKFWFPLWLARLSDVPEGSRFLPYAFRLSVRDHHFELVASNERERQLWVDALGDAIFKAPLTPPGSEPAFPSSLFLDAGSVGLGESTSRPSSRAAQRSAARMSMPAASSSSGLIDSTSPSTPGRTELSPRKARFSASPATLASAKFESSTSPLLENGPDDPLQQYFDEDTSEIQVRRCSAYRRSVINQSMAFSASIIAARAPRSAHNVAGGSNALASAAGFDTTALQNSFALVSPTNGPGWQQSLGALVGLGRMGSMETSTLKVQRRKSCAGNVEGLTAYSPASDMGLNASHVGLGPAIVQQGSQNVPFPLATTSTPMGSTSTGMSNRAMRTWRQLSLKTAVARSGSLRPMSELYPTSGAVDTGNVSLDSSTAVSDALLGVPIQMPHPPRPSSRATIGGPSRRESFANSLRDALTVSFGRRQRSQSSQDIEGDAERAAGGVATGSSSGLTSGADTPFPMPMQPLPMLHSNLALTPVNGEVTELGTRGAASNGGGGVGGRTDSIRKVFGSLRGPRRERTLSMPSAPEPLSVVESTSTLPKDEQVQVPGLLTTPSPVQDALTANTGAPLHSAASPEEARGLLPPSRSFSRASIQRSRTALGKIWWGQGHAQNGGGAGSSSSSSAASDSAGSNFLAVGGLVRSAHHFNRQSTDSWLSSRSKSAVALPTYASSAVDTTMVGHGGDASRSVPVSAGHSPSEGPNQALYFSTSSTLTKTGTASPTTATSSSPTSSLAMRRPRLGLKLSSTHHRMSNAMGSLPTLPATPAEELEMHLGGTGAPTLETTPNNEADAAATNVAASTPTSNTAML